MLYSSDVTEEQINDSSLQPANTHEQCLCLFEKINNYNGNKMYEIDLEKTNPIPDSNLIDVLLLI